MGIDIGRIRYVEDGGREYMERNLEWLHLWDELETKAMKIPSDL